MANPPFRISDKGRTRLETTRLEQATCRANTSNDRKRRTCRWNGIDRRQDCGILASAIYMGPLV